MKKNMGILDRALRIVLALLIVGLYFAGLISGVSAIVLLVIGGVLVLTSFVGICPLYLPFGLSTLKK